MKVYQINIGDVACAVHVNHGWSPADCVFALGTSRDNTARFTIGQIPDLQAALKQCMTWVAENDPLGIQSPTRGDQDHEL